MLKLHVLSLNLAYGLPEELTTLVDLKQEKNHVVTLPPIITRAKELRAQVLYRLERYEECFSLYRELIRNTSDDFEMERLTNLSAVSSYLSEDKVRWLKTIKLFDRGKCSCFFCIPYLSPFVLTECRLHLFARLVSLVRPHN